MLNGTGFDVLIICIGNPDCKRTRELSSSSIRIDGYGVLITPLQGEHKQQLLVDDYQGKALLLEVCEEVLVAVTSENRIRLWKVGHSEVKSAGLPSGRKVW